MSTSEAAVLAPVQLRSSSRTARRWLKIASRQPLGVAGGLVVTAFVIMALIALSLVVLTGYLGQISLASMAYCEPPNGFQKPFAISALARAALPGSASSSAVSIQSSTVL